MTGPGRAAATWPGVRAVRAIPAAGLLPAALCAVLAGVTWLVVGAARPPAWLDAAQVHARAVATLGESLLGGVGPAADPRLLPAAGLLLLGLSPALVLLLARLAGLLAAVAAVLLLARPGKTPEDGHAAGAYWPAVSAIWIESALAGDPHILLGLILLLVSRSAGPLWLRVAGVAWGLGWSPWAWLLLPPLLLGGWLDPTRVRRRDPAILLLALVSLWVLSPPALLDPRGWLAGMTAAARAAVAADGGGGFGLRRSLLPLTGSLHVAGALLALAALPGWARRIRAGDLGPVAVLAAVGLAARASFASIAPILVLLPWVAGEAGRGWGRLTRWRPLAARPRLAWACAALLLLPSVGVLAGRWQRPEAGRTEPGTVAQELERRLPPGSLVVHDLGYTPPDSTRLVWLALPFHAQDPAVYAGAYWPGWFRGVGAFVATEELVLRFVRAPERSAAMVQFYAHLTATAREEVPIGGTPGHRTRILLADAAAEGLGAGWRERIDAGVGGDLPGEFIAALGAALAGSGRAGESAELLQYALAAGYDQVGIYLNLAGALLELDRVMEAGRLLDDAHRRHPESPEVLFNLGLALSRAELWNRAVRTLAQLQLQWPRSAQVSYLLGVALANDGKPAAAVRQIEQALEQDPTLPQRSSARELLARLKDVAR